MTAGPEHRYEPADVLRTMAGCDDPLLVGVRHHSSALAAAIEPLLEAFRPDHVLVELPAEFAPWVPWVGHVDAVAPLALAAVAGGAVAFYPFADFSPELAVLRWAVRQGVPCEPFDLPVGRRGEARAEPPAVDGTPNRIGPALLGAAEAADPESLWDQLVEAPAAGATPEQTRRAALLYGWSLRADTGSDVRTSDLARERFMRMRLRAARAAGKRRVVAVVGAFHAAALLDDPATDPLPRLPEIGEDERGGEVVTSLLPYGTEQLDSRSGYPAGIRDPRWHQRVYEARRDGRPLDDVAGEVLVEVCRRIRDERHVAGTPDAAEALRLARGLAALRDLPAPGRRELLEAVASVLSHGEVLGRGRVVARALDRVLVGRARGRLAPGTPRSGLAPHVETLLAALGKLPGPDDPPLTDPLRLDPLRSELDRRRHVTLERLNVAGIAYGDALPTDDEALTHVWRVAWTAETEATLAAAALRGVTLEQAAAGALRARARDLEDHDRLGAGERIRLLAAAASANLVELVAAHAQDLRGAVVLEAGLADLVRAIALVERIAHGHVPGCPVDPARADDEVPGRVATVGLPGLGEAREELLAAAVRAVDGLQGSDDLGDVAALVALVRVFELAPERLGDGRLGWALERLAADGSARIQGGAGGARVLLGIEPADVLGERIGSWVDAATDSGARRVLAQRLQGTLTAIGPQLEGHPALLGQLMARVAALDDEAFLARLPALREGFDFLSPAARDRLLHAIASAHLDPAEPRPSAELDDDPRLLAVFAAADLAGAQALRVHGLEIPADPAPAPLAEEPPAPAPDEGGRALKGRDRWRLVLGRQRQRLNPAAARYARALDELYGGGRGEGSRAGLGREGGSEDPYPTVREWSEDLAELFGGEIRQDVVGRAAEGGNLQAVLELDPASVLPSVALLEQVLSLRGGLSEAQLGALRRLVERIVRQLVDALAERVRPALTGLAVPRPTRRRTDRLDLRRTVAANLRHARPGEEPPIVPERLVFRTRGRRSVDWRVVLVVDTSGSMDANVIHSAMMAAILSALPAVTLHFVAFSTAIVDLTDRADDALGLLLEVRVGGGTDIGKAVRYARGLVTAPTRTICVVVSDFEEGGPVGRLVAEVRALVEAGVKVLGLAALDDSAKPNFNVAIAELLAGAGMPIAALTPLELARWVGEQIR